MPMVQEVKMPYLYNFALLAGTAFLVVFYDWSAWWFLLTVAAMAHK
jgi:hypothetical protein